MTLGQVLENIQKSAESDRFTSENHENAVFTVFVYVIKRRYTVCILVARAISRSFAALIREIKFI